MLLVIRFTKMPKNGDQSHSINLGPTLKRIFSIPHYREGVVAQFFYVGAQIMCWTFIIQYGTHLFMSQGMEEKAAEVLSQEYNIIAMIIFCISRFVCTFILRYLNPGKLLAILAVAGCFFTAGVIFFQNIWGMYCLVGRFGAAPVTSKHHRHAYALEYACGKPIIYPAVHLFCGDCHLWTSLLQTRAILKPPDREISNQ